MDTKPVNDTETNDFLKHLMGLSYNRKCADCGSNQPSWATLTYSFFICYDCAAQHRKLGVAKSKVKSTQIDAWSVEEVRRMYVGGNKNVYKLPESNDFNIRYADCDSLVKDLDGLVAKSEKSEPGDSFMKRKRIDAKTGVKPTKEIKKGQKPKFSDVIEENSSEEEVAGKEDQFQQENKPFFEEVDEEESEDQHFGLVRSKKSSESLKKSVTSSRSPFSFKPTEADSNEEE